ncbi:MAG: hypothetical protein JWQ03_164, partial [Variovorax sp.]|nr:hypothetical protein [Variovorax sp.]
MKLATTIPDVAPAVYGESERPPRGDYYSRGGAALRRRRHQ